MLSFQKLFLFGSRGRPFKKTYRGRYFRSLEIINTFEFFSRPINSANYNRCLSFLHTKLNDAIRRVFLANRRLAF